MIIALFFEERSVGKHLKFTKKRFTWKFEIDGKEYILDLFLSRLTGKKKIRLNGDIQVESNTPLIIGGGFPIQIGSHRLMVILIGDSTFDLRIDNTSFQSLYARGHMKTQTSTLNTMTDPWASISSQPSGYSHAFARRDDEEDDRSDGYCRARTFTAREDEDRDRDRYGNPSRVHNNRKSDPWEDYSNLEKAEKENEWGESSYKKSVKQVVKEDVQNRSPLRERSTNREDYQTVRNTYIPNTRPNNPSNTQNTQPPAPTQPSVHLQNAPNPFDIMEDYKPAPKLPEDLFSSSNPSTSPSYSTQTVQNVQLAPVNIQPNMQPPRVFTPNSSQSSTPFNQEVIPTSSSCYNPFDDSNSALTETPPIDEWSKVADLDNLDKGNYHSPFIANRIAEANKPPTVSGDIPNKPMLELGGPMSINQGYMTNMGMNPMMMAYNQYMTSMLMAQHMMSYPK